MCGVCGYITTKPKMESYAKTRVTSLLVSSAVRGKDATGIAFVDAYRKKNNALFILKQPLEAEEYVALKEVRETLKGVNPSILIGHTRAKTQGDAANNNNNHPITDQNGLALVHNGMISNDDDIFESFKLNRIAQVDSEAIVQLISHFKNKKKKTTVQAIQLASAELRGSMACAMIDAKEKDALYLWASTSPMTIGYEKSTGNIYFASTKEILAPSLELYGSYLEFFYEQVNSVDIVYRTLPDDTGIVIKKGKIEAFKIERPAYVSRAAAVYTSAWCYQCKDYHMPDKHTVKEEKKTVGFKASEVIKKPGMFSSAELDQRLEHLYDIRKDSTLSKAQLEEIHRIENTLDYRMQMELRAEQLEAYDRGESDLAGNTGVYTLPKGYEESN